MAVHLSAGEAPIVSPQLLSLAHLVTGIIPLHFLTNLAPAECERMCGLAVRQGVAPFLYRQLHDEHLLPALPRPGYAALLEAHSQTAGYNLLALEAAQSWNDHLETAGIPGVWIKGLPLSLSIYPAPDTRPMIDIDVLVPPADRAAAIKLAQKVSGSRPVMLRPDQAIHAIFPVGAAGRVKMELHWSLIAPLSSSMAPDLDWFLQNVLLLPVANKDLCTLSPEAHLLYLCAHAQLGHGESQFMLLRYLDLHRLLNTYPRLDWEQVVTQAIRFRWTYAVERALRIAQAYFETTIPDEALRMLSAYRPADEDISLVQQRGIPGTRWDRLQVRLQGEDSPGRLRLALALLFPPPAYIRWRYQVKGWKVLFYYPYRWFDGLREFTRSK